MDKIEDSSTISPIRFISTNPSLIDFPGVLAAMTWVQGCNLKCGFCHNPTLIPITTKDNLTYVEVVKQLNALKNNNWVDGVVISGGEPTLYKGLGTLVKLLKEEVGLRIKIDSNGSRPTAITGLLELLDVGDYVALDYKICKDLYTELTGCLVGEDVLTSIRLIRSSGIPFELRTTIIEGIHTEEVFKKMMVRIGKEDLWILQEFKSSATLLDPSFQDRPDTPKIYVDRLCEIAKDKGYNISVR